MEPYLILARSITYAQRMQRVLGRGGLRCQISRAPRTLTDLGCAYVVGLETNDIGGAILLLQKEGLEPLGVFRRGGQEVTLR